MTQRPGLSPPLQRGSVGLPQTADTWRGSVARIGGAVSNPAVDLGSAETRHVRSQKHARDEGREGFWLGVTPSAGIFFEYLSDGEPVYASSADCPRT